MGYKHPTPPYLNSCPFFTPSEWPVSNSVAQEEPSGSWQEEFLIAKGTGHRRPVCMVCGDVLSASGPATARDHILRQHPHSLDFSMEEKRNILEAWNEESEAGLPPSPEGKRQGCAVERPFTEMGPIGKKVQE